jgi:hypothetical protein
MEKIKMGANSDLNHYTAGLYQISSPIFSWQRLCDQTLGEIMFLWRLKNDD